MPGPINTLYIMGADARGVVLGANQANMALNGMVKNANAAQAALSKGTRGIFNNTAQWAFALQDIATVLSMGGGMTRALLSGANNIAFLVSASGTLKGFWASMGITLGAVIVPKLFEAVTVTKRFREELEAAKAIGGSIELSVSRAVEGHQGQRGIDEAIAAGGDAVEQELATNQKAIADLLAATNERQRQIDNLRVQQQKAFNTLEQQMSGALSTDLLPGQSSIGTFLERAAHDATGGFFGMGDLWAEEYVDALSKGLDEALTAQQADMAKLRELQAQAGQLMDAQKAAVSKDPFGFATGLFGVGHGLRQGRVSLEGNANLNVMREMGNQINRQMESLEGIEDIERDLLALRERSVALVTKGSVEEANARQRSMRASFDAQHFAGERTDAEMRRLLQLLANALRDGVRLVPVR